MRSRRGTASTSDETPAPLSTSSASMRTEMIQRTSSTSEGAGAPGPAPRIWGLGSAIRKIQSMSSNKEKDWVCLCCCAVDGRRSCD